jgi:hypothetical protein
LEFRPEDRSRFRGPNLFFMRFAFLVLSTLICSTWLPAQTSVSGPVEALTFDPPTRSVRAVFGLPGAASFGPALLDNLELASVAPAQNYGIVFADGECFSVSGLGSKISKAAIQNVPARPRGIAWAAGGSLAILYSGSWFQTIAGFPNAPEAGATVDVSTLGGSLTAVASDAPGKQIAVAVNGEQAGVYLFSGGQFTRLASLAQPISLSFSPDGETLYALDAATLQITAITLSSHGIQTLPLPGLTNPVAIQAFQGESGVVLYVAAGSDRVLRVLDVSSEQAVANVALLFQPTGLAPFGSNSFVLASRSQAANPLWLLSSTPQPAAYFVPAVQLRPASLNLAPGRTQ